MDLIDWIQDWYKSNCNGDWEHSYGVSIDTLDNPGWSVKIDLKNTKWENLKLDPKQVEKNEEDWYYVKIQNFSFQSACSPNNLKIVLNIFKNITQ